MDMFDIDILDEITPEQSRIVQLPLNILKIGEIAPDDVKIYIHQDVYRELMAYASSDTGTELGSILVGDYINDSGAVSVIISGFIQAKYTDASAASLTFTHETWNDIYRELDQDYPDKRIVGWQHTHPDYGIFLSSFDLFIQENYFREPFQLAFVIDPVKNENGFFQWKKGTVTKSGGYYLYDEINVKLTAAQTGPGHRKTLRRKAAVIALTAVLLLALAFVLAFYWNDLFGNNTGNGPVTVQEHTDQQELMVKDPFIGQYNSDSAS